jgi:hypothetical protein
VVARVILVLAALTATASADPHAELSWRAPAGCPDAAEVRARIEQRLGRPVSSSIDRVVHGIDVDISAAPGGFSARIDPSGLSVASSVRTLTAARCDELADAVAVVIVRLAAELRAPAPSVQPAARVAVQAPAAEQPRVWGAGVRVLGNSGIGAQPGIGTGTELGVYARRDQAFAEVAATYWRPTTQVILVGARGHVDIRLRTVALRAGWHPAELLRIWLSGELGTLRGESIDLGTPAGGSQLWASLGAGFGVAWPMTDYMRLVGALELAVPLRGTHFFLVDGMELYHSDPGTVRCGLGLEVGWP